MSSSARGRARPDSIAEPDVLDNLASFTRHLRAENKAYAPIRPEGTLEIFGVMVGLVRKL